jgi:hypothetical protein
MPERREHAVSGGRDGRSERPEPWQVTPLSIKTQAAH